MTQINLEKVVAYGVETPELKLEAQKVVVYAVEMLPLTMEVQKLTVYAAEVADASGNAFQSVAGDRPTYRAGPDPYIEFGAGDTLRITLLADGPYTLITYRPDDSFTTQLLTLAAGQYTLPAVNFNQLALIPGTLSSIAEASIKHSMRVRAGNA